MFSLSLVIRYANQGHATQVETSSPQLHFASYLPHHEIIKEDRTTTKLRIVFDGSAGTNSVNQSLDKDDVNMNLLDRLMQFRKRE